LAEGRIVVVRHGETEWSLSGRHTGTTDLPLTEAGTRLAAALAALLPGGPYALVLSSPMQRALQTCELAGFSAEVEHDLREWDYGDYEGLTTPEIWAANPEWNLWRDGCPGGESPAEVAARADRVIARCAAAAGGDALLFAHGHILRVLTARWIGLDAAGGARFALEAAAFGVLGHERDTRVVERWNSAPQAR
jgi:probable phosphoglycerate mutase